MANGQFFGPGHGGSGGCKYGPAQCGRCPSVELSWKIRVEMGWICPTKRTIVTSSYILVNCSKFASSTESKIFDTPRPRSWLPRPSATRLLQPAMQQRSWQISDRAGNRRRRCRCSMDVAENQEVSRDELSWDTSSRLEISKSPTLDTRSFSVTRDVLYVKCPQASKLRRSTSAPYMNQSRLKVTPDTPVTRRKETKT